MIDAFLDAFLAPVDLSASGDDADEQVRYATVAGSGGDQYLLRAGRRTQRFGDARVQSVGRLGARVEHDSGDSGTAAQVELAALGPYRIEDRRHVVDRGPVAVHAAPRLQGHRPRRQVQAGA